MLNVILTGSLAFVITFLAIPAIMRVAEEKKLFDLPDSRKLHTTPIASLGGVGIFLGLFLSSLLTITTNQNAEIKFVFASGMVVFFLGLKDDILVISALKKFLGQIAAAAILVHLAGIRIESMHGILGLGTLPEPISYLISYATIIVIVNAYNLIDGVDGLAGSLGLMTTALFGIYFFAANMPAYSLMAFAMAGSLLAFLVFNFNPAKIFMGDSGSLLLGLVNAILVIKFIAVADAPGAQIPVASTVAVAVSILIVPLLDTLRVFSIRLAKGRSPFIPDRNHIHHLLLDRGLNHRYVTVTCVGLNAGFIVMAYFGRELGSNLLLILMVAASAAFVGMLMLVKKPASTLVISSSFQHLNSEPVIQSTGTKIVSITNDAAVAEQ
ncbi:MAG TPA: MraY family glycosyltransferase [Flavisolibacter sp.]|jgi:UDP-N-acetylmuramyl pentapeptide phosphotransferase/UDP-N-acetylglucosamine-1-phosphate transferase|nr:MraY family glycosyltransferase [Flavisolibacter sp.]